MNTLNNRISIFKAIKTALKLIFLAEESPSKAFHMAFTMRKLFNMAYDDGWTPEELDQLIFRDKEDTLG